MKTFRTLACLAALFASTAALHAASSDALAVLQQCGQPRHDAIVSPSRSAAAERVLTYPAAALHFTALNGGWSFLYASQGRHTRLEPSQAGLLMPCVKSAMDKAQLYAPLPVARPPAQPAAAAAPTLSQRWLRPTSVGFRPLVVVPLVLLYLLPILIGVVRRPRHLRALILIDLLAGWTVVGWCFALLLANDDPPDPSEEFQEDWRSNEFLPREAGNPICLNLSSETEEQIQEQIQEQIKDSPHHRAA